MENNVCPVCGNPGVGDYYHENVVCNNCGSDLSIFHVIQKERDRKRLGNILYLSGLLLVLALSLFIGGSILSTRSASVIAEKDATITQLQSEINDLQSKVIAKSVTDSSPVSSEGSFKYTIRRGDSFCSISRRFYGTEGYYEELAKDNGLDVDSRLVVGQQLVIKTR